MSKDSLEKISRINFEQSIWLSFIILNILTIYADKVQKESLVNGDKKDKKQIRFIYICIVVTALPIYYYFWIRNCYDLSKAIQKGKDVLLYELRVMGIVLIFLGAIFIFIFQILIKDSSEEDLFV